MRDFEELGADLIHAQNEPRLLMEENDPYFSILDYGTNDSDELRLLFEERVDFDIELEEIDELVLVDDVDHIFELLALLLMFLFEVLRDELWVLLVVDGGHEDGDILVEELGGMVMEEFLASVGNVADASIVLPLGGNDQNQILLPYFVVDIEEIEYHFAVLVGLLRQLNEDLLAELLGLEVLDQQKLVDQLQKLLVELYLGELIGAFHEAQMIFRQLKCSLMDTLHSEAAFEDVFPEKRGLFKETLDLFVDLLHFVIEDDDEFEVKFVRKLLHELFFSHFEDECILKQRELVALEEVLFDLGGFEVVGDYLKDRVSFEEVARNEHEEEIQVLVRLSLEMHQSRLEEKVELAFQVLRINLHLQQLQTETVLCLASLAVVQNVDDQFVIVELLMTVLHTELERINQFFGRLLLFLRSSHHPHIPMSVEKMVEVAEEKRNEHCVYEGYIVLLGVLEECEEVHSGGEVEQRSLKQSIDMLGVVLVENSLVESEINLHSPKAEKN